MLAGQARNRALVLLNSKGIKPFHPLAFGRFSPTATGASSSSSSLSYMSTVPGNSNNDNNITTTKNKTHVLRPEQIRKVDAIFHQILWLDMFELFMITEVINERLGRTLTPSQEKELRRQMDAFDAQQDAGVSSEHETTEPGLATAEPVAVPLVEVRLTGFDEKQKIKVIKEVRAVAGLGLKEAKDLVESAPKSIQKDLKPEQAAELKKRLEESGAIIDIV